MKSRKTETAKVVKLMKPLMPKIEVERETENTLTFCIPWYFMRDFAEMWEKVWSQKDQLHLKKYDIVSQSFEEIFTLLSKEKVDIEKISKKMPEENIKDVQLFSGFELFRSHLKSMALKKLYNPAAQLPAVLVCIIGLILITIAMHLTPIDLTSEVWRRMGNSNKGQMQILQKAQIRFFIDRGGGGEFYKQFSGFRKSLENKLSTHFEDICPQCIAMERPPGKFFEEMPYPMVDLIPKNFLTNKQEFKQRSTMSFTYALENFENDRKLAAGLIKTKKTMTVYINMQEAHTSFLSLNFIHSLILL